MTNRVPNVSHVQIRNGRNCRGASVIRTREMVVLQTANLNVQDLNKMARTLEELR